MLRFPKLASKKFSNKVVAKVNELAGIIRAQKQITWAHLMVKANIGSSTLYAYRKVLLELHKDIEFDGEIFRAKKG